MMKVYLEGFSEPYAVIGTYVSEDERYMILFDGSIKRRIPHRRIVHIEDLSEAVEQVPALLESQPPEPKGQKDSTAQDKIKELLQEKLGHRSAQSKKDPIKETIDAKGPTQITVMITGAVERTIPMHVPSSAMTGERYTPSLSKEIALNNEIKSIMDGGIIFDGVPSVVGTNVYIKTKHLVDTANSKLGMATKLAGLAQTATNAFSPPGKVFQTDFSMNSHTKEDFALKGSPFDGPVPLEAGDEVEILNDNESIVEVQDENTGKEEGTSQAKDDEGVPVL